MPSLVFHPSDPDFIPESLEQIVQSLQQHGFIGEVWSGAAGQRYLIGDKFLSLVTFMGCAPYIALEPPAQGEDFCHIEFSPIHDSMQFIFGARQPISRCPQCRQRKADWQSIPPDLQYHCAKCGGQFSLTELDWRHNAGYGHVFISVHGIYPHEAIPTSSLLSILEQALGVPCSYFYIQ